MSKFFKQLVVIIAAVTIAISAFGTSQPHAADACREDESWVAVDYLDPRGSEDLHGVSRACVNVESDS